MYKNIVTTFLAAASGPAEEESLPRPLQKLLQPEISQFLSREDLYSFALQNLPRVPRGGEHTDTMKAGLLYKRIVEAVKEMAGFSNLDIQGDPRNGLGGTLDFLWTNEDLLKSFKTSRLSSLPIETIQMGLLNPDQAADFITILESFRERLHARIDAARVALSPFLRDGVFHDNNLRFFRVYFPDAGPITDAVMSHLANIPNLMYLDLSHQEITDAVMSHLAKLTNLQVLILSFTLIGDAGMAHLAKLPNLQELFLSHTGITDTGLLDSVNPSNFPKLRKLAVPVIQISPETIDELRRRFPGIEIL